MPASALAQPPLPAHQPRLPARSTSDKKVAVLVGIAVTVALVVSISIGVTLTSREQTPAAAASTTTTTAMRITPSAAALYQAFPAMVPADPDTGTGYGGGKCFSRPNNVKDNWWDPDFGDWQRAIQCAPSAQATAQINYRIYVYNTALAVESVVRGLPLSVKSVDSNKAAGKAYTNYAFADTGNQGEQGHAFKGHRIVTVFTGDPARAQFLMYTEWLSETPTIAGTAADLKQWWKSAPLN